MAPARLRATVERDEGGARLPEVQHEQRDGRFGGAGLESRAEARVGMGISTPSREDVARVSAQGRHQQMSPPTSPTFPRISGTSPAIPRQMPNVSADALDDPTPPKSFLTKKARPLPEPKVTAMSKRTERRDAQPAHTVTPPSPPQPKAQSLPSAVTAPLPPPPASLQVSSRAPARSPVTMLPSPVPDETGALPSTSNLKVSPSLGNSLEAPRGPRRAKYSPLAAFGPPVSTETSAGSSSSVSSPQDLPPPPPPKPHSPAAPTFNIRTSIHVSSLFVRSTRVRS